MITQKVVDIQTNLPIEGAHVYVTNQPTYGAATNEQGIFVLSDMSGSTELTVSHILYETFKVKVFDLNQTVYLIPKVESLPEIELIGTKKKSNAGAIFLSLSALALLAAAALKRKKPKKVEL